MSKPTFTEDDEVTHAKFTLKLAMIKPKTSPLLSLTPPSVLKSLIKAYPYLIITNKILSVVTWTNEDYWINVTVLAAGSLLILYFEKLVTYSGHLLLVLLLTAYAVVNKEIHSATQLETPSLDEIVHQLTTTTIKSDILLSPITSLSLTARDIKRLLFTTLFLTPLYLIITLFLIKPRSILFLTFFFIFSYNSPYSRVIRRLIWKLKISRIIVFYLTGLNLNKTRNNENSIFQNAISKVKANQSGPARFTYVIYENQRRWLGIGWTANLLTYERAPWTDEFLNESESIENFKLPSDNNWKWVDKSWRLDLSNDGAITTEAKKTTPSPEFDQGYIFYDNTWRKPSTDDTFAKYTRRRRWIRTAELEVQKDTNDFIVSEESIVESNKTTSSSVNKEDSTKKRRILRFEQDLNKTTIDEKVDDTVE